MMMESSPNKPRRITSTEERELLAAQQRVADAQAATAEALAARDRLIAELLDSGGRGVDVAEVLGLTPQAVRDARDRAR